MQQLSAHSSIEFPKEINSTSHLDARLKGIKERQNIPKEAVQPVIVSNSINTILEKNNLSASKPSAEVANSAIKQSPFNYSDLIKHGKVQGAQSLEERLFAE